MSKKTRLGICILLLLACQRSAAQSFSMQWSHAEAGYNGKSNCIKWTTAYEAGCKEYSVEKSINGDNWQEIALPVAAHNTNGPNQYQLYDPSMPASVTWYRIRKTDNDGRITYSVTLIAQIHKGIIVQLYNHPSTGDYIITAGQTLRVVKLFNASDSLIYETAMNGISYHTIDSRELAAGDYYALIQLQDGNIVKEYFTKR
jgi:hypothetical protein